LRIASTLPVITKTAPAEAGKLNRLKESNIICRLPSRIGINAIMTETKPMTIISREVFFEVLSSAAVRSIFLYVFKASQVKNPTKMAKIKPTRRYDRTENALWYIG
jgi:hypothetical protein